MKISSEERLKHLLDNTQDKNTTINKNFMYDDNRILETGTSIFGIFQVYIDKIDSGIGQLQSYYEELEDITKKASNNDEIGGDPYFDMDEWKVGRFDFGNKKKLKVFDVIENFPSEYISYIEEIEESIEDRVKSKKIIRNEMVSDFLEVIKDYKTQMDRYQNQENKEVKELVDFEFEDFEKKIGTLIAQSTESLKNENIKEEEINGLDEESEDKEEYDLIINDLETELSDIVSDKEREFSEIESLVDDELERVKTYIESIDSNGEYLNGMKNDLKSEISSFLLEIKNQQIKGMEYKSKAELSMAGNHSDDKCEFILNIPGNNKHSGEWFLYNDSSIKYKDFSSNGDFLVSNHNPNEFDKQIKKMVASFIGYKSRKHPTLIEIISEKIISEKKMDTGLALLNEIIVHKKVLSNSGFNLNDKKLKHVTIEKIYDEVQGLLLKEKSKSVMKRMLDGKYRTLILDDTGDVRPKMVKVGLRMIEEGIDKSVFQDNIGKKLDYYLNIEGSIEDKRVELENDTIKMIKTLGGWHINNYINKIESNNNGGMKILSKDKNQLMVSVKSFKECKSVGSPSWCIARTESFWDSYIAHGEFYILYDFNKDAESNQSIVGFHVNQNGIRNAHWKNDSSLKSDEKSTLLNEIESRGFRKFGKEYKMIPNNKFEDYVLKFMSENPNYKGGGEISIENTSNIKEISGTWDKIVINNSNVERVKANSKTLVITNNNDNNLKIEGKISKIDIKDVGETNIQYSELLEVSVKNAKSLKLDNNSGISNLTIDNVEAPVTLEKSCYIKLRIKDTEVGNLQDISSKILHIDKLTGDLTFDNYGSIEIQLMESVNELMVSQKNDFTVVIHDVGNLEILENFDAPMASVSIINSGGIKELKNINVKSLTLVDAKGLKLLEKNKIETIYLELDKDQDIKLRRNRFKHITTNQPELLRRSSSNRLPRKS